MPSERRNPSASSSSCPGVRIVTATGSPPIRISSGSSTATTSVSVRPAGKRNASTTSVEYGGASLGCSPLTAASVRSASSGSALGLGANVLERGSNRRLPGSRNCGTPERPEAPEVRPQLAAVLELGLALELAQLEGLENVRNRTAHEPEVHAVGRVDAHGLDGRRR